MGGYSFSILRQETERNSLPFYGFMRQVKEKRSMTFSNQISLDPRKLLERKIRNCSGGRAESSLAQEERLTDSLSSSQLLFSLNPLGSKAKTWVSQEYCFIQGEKTIGALRGPASACKHRPTTAPPETWQFSCLQRPLESVRIGY